MAEFVRQQNGEQRQRKRQAPAAEARDAATRQAKAARSRSRSKNGRLWSKLSCMRAPTMVVLAERQHKHQRVQPVALAGAVPEQ